MWAGIISGILVGILKSLATQRVASEVMVKVGWYLAEKSENKLDDSLMKTLEEALGVKR